MSDAEGWVRAYARQTQVDLAAYNVLRRVPGLPSCQHLHFLQIACEKLCKAYLCCNKTDPALLQTSHAFTAAVLPEIFQEERRRLKQHTLHPYSTLWRQGKSFCREIELLAPTVNSLRRPDNCEHPWEDAEGNVVVPAEHSFATLTLLYQQPGYEPLKIFNCY